MAKAITGARAELGEFAPRIEVMNIPVDKIRDVIGSGGKVRLSMKVVDQKTGKEIVKEKKSEDAEAEA
jgi:polyribonucleotide nucleotidyltransferase